MVKYGSNVARRDGGGVAANFYATIHNNMRPIVLLTHAIHPDAMQRLGQEAEVRLADAHDEPSLCRAIADAAGIIVRMPLSPAVISAGKNLKVVARHGVGLDYIPVGTCTELGLPVIFTPNANTESVAEHVIGSMIGLAHYFGPADRAVRSHAWAKRDHMVGVDLFGRSIGIIGMGRIGARVAAICRTAFNMRVLAYDPHLSPDAIRERGGEPASFEAVLAQAEFLTLHLPSNAETRHIIDAKALAAMRRGAYLINAARGALVDSVALAQAIKDGRVRGAALDVLEEEPPTEQNPLLELDNVIFTPHSAALTEEAMLRMGMDSSEDVLRVLRGEAPVNCANRDDLRRHGKAV
jgi:D-3-phosphoglycerate dehydrogenase